MIFGFQPVIPNLYYFQYGWLITHEPQFAGIVFNIKIRFKILAAFEDDVRSVWDSLKKEQTGKAEEMNCLLSERLTVTVL